MKLYSLIGHASIADPVYGNFERDDSDGSFELPMELARTLHAVHINGKPAWEDESERLGRLVAAEDARRRDPATLLAAVQAATAAAVLAATPHPMLQPVPPLLAAPVPEPLAKVAQAATAPVKPAGRRARAKSTP